MRREEFNNKMVEFLKNPSEKKVNDIFDQVTAPHWISVEDKLPKEWEDKLFVLYTEPLNPDYTYFGRYRIGEFDGDEMTFYLWENHRWKIYGRNDDNTKVTHWMPLPEAPTVAENATVKKGGDE